MHASPLAQFTDRLTLIDAASRRGIRKDDSSLPASCHKNTRRRVRGQAHLEVKASQSRPSVGIRIPRASLPIARRSRQRPSRRAQARRESQSNCTNAYLAAGSAGACFAWPRQGAPAPQRPLAPSRMHQVKEDQNNFLRAEAQTC